MHPARSYSSVERLKPVSRTIGILVGVTLALIGLMTVTRGTPLKRVVHGVHGRAPAVSDSSFRELMALFVGVHLEPGNAVEMLLNGDGTYPRLWQDLRAARQTITIQNYYSKPGQVADSLAAILSERARAGVEVMLLLDAFGSQSLKKSWVEALQRSGVRVAVLRKVKWYSIHNATDRSHVRAYVIDGRVGYTGGFGLADYWLGDGRKDGEWRESNVRFEGPAVNELQAAFAAAWVEATGDLLVDQRFFPRPEGAGDITAALLYTAPTRGSTTAERFLALSIAGASRTLYVANSYFVPDDDFRELLTTAVARGVDVRVLTTSEKSDVLVTWYGGRARYPHLLRGGVRIYEYLPTMMHAKTMVVDGLWASIGAMNFDNRSLAFNNESNLVIWDRAFGAGMDSTFFADLAFAREIRLAEFTKRPWTVRLVELGASVLQRIL